jgi:RNA recognition motif-containing protein
MPEHSSDTAQSRSGSGQGRRRRNNRSRNRGEERTASSSGGHYSVTRREPKPSGLQKFLSTISFGLLGKSKPAAKPAAKSSTPSSTARQESRPAREAKPAQAPRQPREREQRFEANPAEVTTERLYVGNLSYDATESDLLELFNGVGQVRSAEVVVNNRTQRSKGFAFVTMTDVEQARRAVVELSNKDFMGRPLQVSGAKPPAKDREGSTEE